MKFIQLEKDEELFELKELFYDGIEGTFKNILFIEQNQTTLISDKSIVIFAGSGRALSKMDSFIKQKCVFVVDQHDSIEKFEALQFKIE